MSLEDVEFTEEDMAEVVEPLREVAIALGKALRANNRVHNSKASVATADLRWSEFADKVAAFMKVTDA